MTSFADFGLCDPLIQTLSELKFTTPTEIQVHALKPALDGKDIIGIAPTGSGKTAAFALPILQSLWNDPKGLFACILAPTRELAFQISQQFESLGSSMGVRCSVIIGGVDKAAQAVALAKRPHIIVATPGRLQDHLESTKGFSLRSIKFLVLDEADRLLDMDFGPAIDKILKVLPQKRSTYLYSATMTQKVDKLQRASLADPVKVEVSSKYQTVSTLLQYYLLMPLKNKDVHLVYLMNSLQQSSVIVFTRTINDASRYFFNSTFPLHGSLDQSQRLGALNKFKSGGYNILVATDIASRGLDIPCVDVVINFDVPTHSKDYIHRVGRTARAGRSGKSVTLVTQYDVELIQRIEHVLGKQMDLWPADQEEIALLKERVEEAGRIAAKELRDRGKSDSSRSSKRKKGSHASDARDLGDDEEEPHLHKKKKH